MSDPLLERVLCSTCRKFRTEDCAYPTSNLTTAYCARYDSCITEIKSDDLSEWLIRRNATIEKLNALVNERQFEVEDDDGTIQEVILKGDVIAAITLLKGGKP